MKLNTIYFDNNATTRVDDEVVEAMLPFFTENYGNASSKLHAFGWQAEAAVDKAKEQVAAFINCEPGELIFTSGATESVNLAIKGIFEAYKTKGNHIITVKTEHQAVLDVCAHLEKQGAIVTYLNVDKEGVIDLEELQNAITDKTVLICVMAANNETGVLQDIEKTGQICAERKIIFFTDATQYIGKMRCDVIEQNIHCMAFSAHKFHGPKGVGFLYINRRIKINPFITGGAQERNMRGGTENVYGIVGLAKALEIAYRDLEHDRKHMTGLKNYMAERLRSEIPGISFNGDISEGNLFTVLNVSFPPSDMSEMMLFNLDIAGIAASGGSACSSGSNVGSHVLKAMNVSPDRPAVRFSFSRFNTRDEVDYRVEKLKEICFVTA